MASINPSLELLTRFEKETPDDEPVVMLNLLKFKERAEYESGRDRPGKEPATGREAYARYSKHVLPLLFEAGGQPLWMGEGRFPLIAPEGESWDEVVLVYYPSRSAFLKMVNSQAYRAIVHHRTAAIADSRLVETRAMRLPKLAIAAARGFVRARALFSPKLGK